jgi:hypothetical protein
MVLFGVRWFETPHSDEYMHRVLQRLNIENVKDGKDLSLYFLRGNAEKHNGIWLLDIEPVIPKLHYLLFGVALGFLVFGVTSWLAYATIAAIFVFSEAWWQPITYVYFMKVGYKKQYKSKPQVWRLSAEEAARVVLRWDK